MFWISGDISKKIGVNGVLTWSLTSYVLRFIIYASIKNPWQVRDAFSILDVWLLIVFVL